MHVLSHCASMPLGLYMALVIIPSASVYQRRPWTINGLYESPMNCADPVENAKNQLHSSHMFHTAESFQLVGTSLLRKQGSGHAREGTAYI